MPQAITKLEDEKDLEDGQLSTTAVVWRRRFKEAENFKSPYDDRSLRMYKLYRAYRDWNGNYAYDTNLMPPIGFETIETVKPRLAAANVNIRVIPTKKEDVKNDSLERWDNLINHDLEVMDFDSKKIDWIDTALKYGNGVSQFSWDSTKDVPHMEVCDRWLLYIDPQADQRLEGTRWIIKQSWKEKEIIKKEEKERGEDRIYEEEVLEEVDNRPVHDDPRRERQEVNAKKMGQVNDGASRNNAAESDSGEGERRHSEYKAVELWECYDFIKQEIVTIANRRHVIRKEPNPYKKINKHRNQGNLFVDLACISLPWEYHAMPMLEPVETTIYEIADSRNQAMDNIVQNLDPIRKVRKGKGYKKEDFQNEPGALWWMDKADDVVIDRPPDISKAWIEKDDILRREIQTSLALSEYTQGMPQSSQEPMGKVELLLMQTNIRFSLLVRQLENAYEDMINIIIEMNQEFLDEDKAFRIAGEDFKFDEFTAEDKETVIDSRVKVTPKKEKSPDQESREVRELYELFVLSQQPDPQDQEAMYKWEKKKAEMEKLILEKMGYDDYEDMLVDEPERPREEPIEEMPMEGQPQGPGGGQPMPQGPGGAMPPGMGGQPMPPEAQQEGMAIPELGIPQKEPILPKEEMREQTTQGVTEQNEGLLQRLMNQFRG